MGFKLNGKNSMYIIVIVVIIIVGIIVFTFIKNTSVNNKLKKDGNETYNALVFMNGEHYSDISDYQDSKNLQKVDNFTRKYEFDASTDNFNKKEKEIYWAITYMNSDLYTMVTYKYDNQYKIYKKTDYLRAKRDFDKMKQIAKDRLGL